ncbi:MAG: 50S ribosomal protein L3 N(5)-glutamine methyltransferase [Pseudomonadota bacterium]
MNDGLESSAQAACAELRSAVDMIRWAASTMTAHGVYHGHGFDNAVDEALHLVLRTLHLPADIPDTLLESWLTRDERAAIAARVRRRVEERKPAAYLTGRARFAGLEFDVDERVLVPRSPIAELIECGFAPWVDCDSVDKVLEIGTGSGCISVACAVHMPWVHIVATDISTEALALARRNATANGVDDRVSFVTGDLFTDVEGRFDLIVSNPPYVALADLAAAPPEFHHEPVVGLAAGEDGLDVVGRMLKEAAHYLSPRGVLVVEVGVSRRYLEAAFPDLPFQWPEFERGGEGVFVIEREPLERLG